MSTKYTNDHEWARTEGDLVVVGITDYAQQQLGEIVFVEAPDAGKNLAAGELAAVVESVKAAGEIKSPLSGEVVQVNDELNDAPEKINQQPMEAGWIYKLKPLDAQQLNDLMDEKDYKTLVESLS